MPVKIKKSFVRRFTAKYGWALVLMLMVAALSGCVSTASFVIFDISNSQDYLTSNEQIDLRFNDGSTAPSGDQTGQSTITINNPDVKTIVGAFLYDSDSGISWVSNYAYNGGLDVETTVAVTKVAETKPALPAKYAVLHGEPVVDTAHLGFVDVTYAVYDANSQLVTGQAEVFAHASSETMFYNNDPNDNGLGHIDNVTEGFSSYTKDGLVTFIIKSDSTDLSSIPLTLQSGPASIPIAPPSIDTQPTGATVNEGDSSPSLSVMASASDSGTLSYQWYSNTENSNSGGTLISGATQASYDAPTDTVGTTYYYVVVTNTNTTATATSNAAGVTVNALVNAATPVIGTQPTDATVNEGDSSPSLSVAATVSDGGEPSYQWYSNTENSNSDGTLISGATSASYGAPTGAAGTTYYYVVVTNTNNSVNGTKTATVTSSTAKVVVNALVNAEMPSIDTQPTDATVKEGDSSPSLSVSASVNDSGTLSYQWYSNTENSNSDGTLISGATSASYGAPTGAAGTTYYYVVVTNTNNSVNGTKTATVTSSTAKVVVNALVNAATPVIDTQPTDATVKEGDSSPSLSVSASVNDSGTLSYQWYSNTTNSNSGGTLISGATSASYGAPTDVAGTTYYYVVVTNTNNEVNGNTTATAASNAAGVTVTPAPVSVIGVTLDQPTLSLTAGGATAALTATVTPTDATNPNVTWSSSDPSVATVADGVVTPVSAGTATITVTTADGGYTARSTVTVAPAPPTPVAVASVTLDQPTLSLTAGGATATLTATVTPSDATNQNVTWSSSDTSVATVAGGVVTPVAAGTATITVTTVDGGYTARSTVTVAPAPPTPVAVASVTLDQPTLSLTAGGATATLTATITPTDATNQTVTWSSSDTSVATVADGVVTPIAAGTATITVTTVDGGYKATSTVTVAPAPPTPVEVTGVMLDQPTLSLTAGGATAALTATVTPSDATNQTVMWSSSDPSVASVADGVVTPIAAGTATITVTTEDGGYTATSEVTIAPAPPTPVEVTGVTLDQPTLSLTAGGATAALTATVTPTDATNPNVTWSSSDPGVATVADGVVTPVSAGTATITVTTEDGGYTATSTVTVAPASPTPVAVASVTLDQPTLSLTAGGTTAALTATVTPSDATNQTVTWSSSDTSVATVANGVVTPVAAGTATITVTTEDGGYTATSTVTVAPASPTPVAVASVTLDQPTLSLTAGGATATLTATVTPSDATNQNVTWSSSDTSVATVAGGVVTPVAAGTATITVTTEDGGYTATSEVTVTSAPVITPPPLSQPSEPSDSNVEVLVNGKSESVGKATTTTENGQKVTTVAVDPNKLEQKLDAEGDNAVVTIPVSTDSDVVVGELDGQTVKNMEQKQATVEIKTDNASYTLPAQQINIDSIASQLGESVGLADIKIQIQIATPKTDTVKVVEDAASKGNFSLVVPPLNFTVTGTYGDKTIEVSKFNAYVKRTIAIPDGVDPSKVTTGVVVDPDGTVRQVPTKVVAIDGKYFAEINSLTNSTYSVMWHSIEFKDVANHWAKDAVNDMGSRMVVEGMDDGLFHPDQSITRAEFASIVVRALGLKLENGSSAFADVSDSAWYSGAVQTAYDYKLIGGDEDGLFHPLDKITREQAMTILDKAMALTGLKDKLAGQGADALLSPYADAAKVSGWAKDSVADNLAVGVVTGRDSGKLDPQGFMTRAEVAAVMQRLLQKSGLI